MTTPQPRATVPMTLPPRVDPEHLVSVVFLTRDGELCSAEVSDVQGRVPFERRQLVGVLRALADQVEQQAKALGS